MTRSLATILFALAITVAANVRAADVIVGFPSSGNPNHSDSFTIDVSVDVGTSVLGSYAFRFLYDPTVVHVVSIGGGSTSQFNAAPSTNPSTFASGSTPFAAAQGSTSSPTHAVSVASITLLAVGDPRNQSDLVIAVDGLFDGAVNPLPANVIGSNVLIAFVPSDPLTTTTTSTSSSTTSSTSTSSSSTTSLPPTTTTSTSTSTSVPTTSSTSSSSSSSTSLAASTSTATSTSTSTTAPPKAVEDCGNCVDDDGNGATDYEDTACCELPASMQVTKGKFVAGKGGTKPGKLNLVSVLATSGLSDVNPTIDDVSIQLRNANGELLCTTVGHGLWKKKKKAFVFKDKSGSAAGLNAGEIRVLPGGSVRFTASGKHVDLSRYNASALGVTVRVGARCSRGSAPLHQKGKGLVFP